MVKPRTSRAAILAQIPGARTREARERESGRRAVAVSYDRRTRRIMMELTSGFVFGFPANAIPALADATAAQLARVELSPGGSALHWEELDADLSVAGLLLASVERSERLSELARLAGSTSTPAKARAARANGKKGGRPRKTARP